MEEACELHDKILALPVDDDSGAPKTSRSLLLGLPDELPISILVDIPLTGASLQSLRLVCRRINDLTNTKAYHHDVAH